MVSMWAAVQIQKDVSPIQLAMSVENERMIDVKSCCIGFLSDSIVVWPIGLRTRIGEWCD